MHWTSCFRPGFCASFTYPCKEDVDAGQARMLITFGLGRLKTMGSRPRSSPDHAVLQSPCKHAIHVYFGGFPLTYCKTSVGKEPESTALQRSATNSSLQLEFYDAMYNAYQLPLVLQGKIPVEREGYHTICGSFVVLLFVNALTYQPQHLPNQKDFRA